MVGIAAIQQSAALPFAYRRRGIKVLLVTSLGTRRWILPKGHLEPGLTACESAESEALEEAGVVGTMTTRCLGSYDYRKRPEKGGERCRVRVYALEVTRILEEYPEAAIRKRQWMSVQKAIKAVQEPGLKVLLERFEKEFAKSAA
ncbi:MAG: NUDIX domain-containing protein [Alphaproteobacteria bacterium]|nr:NUDIX domain-containing protein [Alphaproteobacteria bacterium]